MQISYGLAAFFVPTFIPLVLFLLFCAVVAPFGIYPFEWGWVQAVGGWADDQIKGTSMVFVFAVGGFIAAARSQYELR